MAFDADAYLQALEPPSITIGGETLTGKLCGFNQMLAFQKRLVAMGEGEVDLDGVRQLTEDMCAALGFPADKLLETLPPGALIPALGSFLVSLLVMAPAAGTPTETP